METRNKREQILKAFGRLLDVQERLRHECPWDRKQTFGSLRPNTIEEVYELSDAVVNNDLVNICKELGDVMEHVVLYGIMGGETGAFDLADVCNKQADKLMFRHDFIDWRNKPGDGEPVWTVTDKELKVNERGQVVYKDEQPASRGDKPETAAAVEKTWEQRKQQERHGNKTVLSGVPASLPSMIKAYRIQDKARGVGFDWKKREDVWQKVEEELGELKEALSQSDRENSTKELGDFIFSVINAARLYHLNPDNALESTNQKFIRRFGYIEQRAREKGRQLSSLSLEEMDALWDEAKEKEKAGDPEAADLR